MPDIATERSQQQQLRLGFDPLGGDAQVEAVGQADDRFDDRPAVLGGDHIVDEEAIDLDFGEWQLAKLHQGRITDPEIVHRKPDPLDPEAGQRVHQLDQRLGCALGQLEHQSVGRHVQRAAHSLDQIGKVELLER